MSALRLILGDQLSPEIAALHGADQANDIVLLCEVMEEATYVRHHPKKIAFLFSAMRHFAEVLREQGYRVDYIRLTDEGNSGSFTGEVERAIKRHKPREIITTFPGEYRVLQKMKKWQQQFDLPVSIREDERFYCSPGAFKSWAGDTLQLRMEYFYREMRKQHGVLMDGGKPEGGQWNYDAENRNPPKDGLDIPAPYRVEPDAITREVLQLVGERFGDHFGELEPFHYAVTREQARAALECFIRERLGRFGAFQDAMLEGEPWMFHAHISMYLNAGLLNPQECVAAVETAYRKGDAPLNAAEGFIRQILGWREYVRGVYWLKMPGYAEENYFNARRDLPQWFWTGETRMNCLHQCITETRQHAYAHHI